MHGRFSGSRSRPTNYDIDGEELHLPTRPVDKDKAEAELVVNIKKATNPDETAPKQKHVRSTRIHLLTASSIRSSPLQNVSFTLGTTTLQYRSGPAFECNPF